MQESLQKLQNLLQQLFRADAADLDFGIYRIINYRRNLIQNFIDEELPIIVNDALDANTEAASTHERITELENQVREQEQTYPQYRSKPRSKIFNTTNLLPLSPDKSAIQTV